MRQLGVNNSDSHIAVQVNDSAHPCHRVSQIKARTDVRERQHVEFSITVRNQLPHAARSSCTG